MSTIALHSSLNTSETVRDRGLVSKDHQYETAYEELNGHLTDDVTWAQNAETCDHNMLTAQYLENSWIFSNNR